MTEIPSRAPSKRKERSKRSKGISEAFHENREVQEAGVLLRGAREAVVHPEGGGDSLARRVSEGFQTLSFSSAEDRETHHHGEGNGGDEQRVHEHERGGSRVKMLLHAFHGMETHKGEAV
jgi:hypothetical protein